MSVNWQRDYRYTLGQELKQELMDMMVLIYRANSQREKDSVIAEAREGMERVKIRIRLLHDLHQIGNEKYVNLVEEEGSISKQLARWHAKYMDRPIEQDK